MRILVTNDDGIDSVGLHVLTRAMCDLDGDHEVVVIAPDQEFSGASAAVGSLYDMRPEAHRTTIPHCERAEVWTVNGPPALCVMFARLGAFGDRFDLVVSGINPGANVGRAVYHSGTVGAAITARNGGISGVAISQEVSGFGIEGQGWEEALLNQQWDSAASVGAAVVQGLLDEMPEEPVVVNVNVPNLPLGEITSWRYARVGTRPPRAFTTAALVPIPGHDEAYNIVMEVGEAVTLPPDTDTGAIERDEVAVSYISRYEHEERPDISCTDVALDKLLGPH